MFFSKRIVLFSWLIVFMTIPAFSIFGRSLQRWATTHYSVTEIAIALAFFLSVAGFSILFYLVKIGGKKQLLHFLWLLPLFLLVQFKIPIVEERMHVLLFACFGFLSLQLLGVFWGIGFSIFMAMSDELLQWFLVDRVGEWADVHLNLLSAALGILLAYLIRRKMPLKYRWNAKRKRYDRR